MRMHKPASNVFFFHIYCFYKCEPPVGVLLFSWDLRGRGPERIRGAFRNLVRIAPVTLLNFWYTLWCCCPWYHWCHSEGVFFLVRQIWKVLRQYSLVEECKTWCTSSCGGKCQSGFFLRLNLRKLVGWAGWWVHAQFLGLLGSSCLVGLY